MGGIRESFAAPPLRPSVKHSKTFSSAPTSIRVKEAVRPRHRSTMLTGPIDKPWLTRKDTVGRVAYFITIGIIFLGVVASALRCWSDWRGVKTIGNLCLVLEDQFESSDLDTTSVWQREGDMGGFGNGEFEMATASTNNSFIKNNNLYILPTLTSDVIGRDAIFDGYTYNLTGCTNTNLTACGAVSNQTTGTVINPVMSARISTKGKKSIRYGRVEVRAKIPTGDWMWPAIWMLPENDTYGPWPMSGEIDIMEARGNGPSYPAQGTNYVRGSLNWGPVTWLNAVSKTFGWWTVRRASFDQGFHTYALEWTDKFLRIYVDNRLQHMLELSFNIPFFQRGDFPASVTNASSEIILQNPWANSGNSAPFDQPFYLILDVAIGGTNGWFPDAAGNKPWLNGELDAMRKFALTQDDWSSTWPTDEDQRAMVVDYVKMWQLC
ncbi:glycoside hydrolase family 16 protein [Stereum hirsutum FP-91666 SS1]|uniref:glycoside hydrolase family 16 protein n=1 Tax=Stereum hirsutum (strain FP-91666) TaxID=721885 RepID=UPI000444926E|nr:glycoside hydrolase family 16 protein [Stereum hirsutum FP-91666 SS1]EIM84966.1 glycoside hydrolase family 16 protein [Stereum hirsutum FP-91666 SS1]